MAKDLKSALNERRALFVYEAARIAAIAAEAPIIPSPWDEREEEFKTQFLAVIERQCGPQCLSSPEELHGSWMQAYFSMGWVYGETYDREKRIHPDLVPYAQLDQLERDKDAVFVALCDIARWWIYDDAMPAAREEMSDSIGEGDFRAELSLRREARERIAELEELNHNLIVEHAVFKERAEKAEAEAEELKADRDRFKLSLDCLKLESGLTKCSCCGYQKIMFYVSVKEGLKGSICAWCLKDKAEAQRDEWEKAARECAGHCHDYCLNIVAIGAQRDAALDVCRRWLAYPPHVNRLQGQPRLLALIQETKAVLGDD